MAPEYGATCGFFPVDEVTLDYLRLSGRDESHIDNVRRYYKAQGLFHTADTPDPSFTDTLSLDLATVVPSLAGPKRPQDRITLDNMKGLLKPVSPHLSDTAAMALVLAHKTASLSQEQTMNSHMVMWSLQRSLLAPTPQTQAS